MHKVFKEQRASKMVRSRVAEQHSPVHQYIGENSQKLRSELFTTKRIIPGRKFKIYAFVGLAGLLFGSAKIREIRGYFNMKQKEQAKLARKTLPFF